MSPARILAFDILLATLRGGYASDLLLARAQPLDSRDAGLAHELVFGCLRRQAQLDYLIQHYSGRSQRLDPEVRIALHLGLYQIRYLERIPRHAAVSESVELAKRARKRSAAGFINAVLRKADREPVSWPSPAVEFSCPEWLLAKWSRDYNLETARAIAAAALNEPETYVRTSDPAPELEPTDVPGAFRVLQGSPPPGARVQDIGSQSIVPLLDLQPGLTFLDLCAAPGNKTAQALESGVSTIACDLYPHRLRHVQGCSRIALDAAQPLPFRTQFQRILVDAPCTGTGTLARNPEIKWRLTPSDPARLAQLQRDILLNALRALTPNGRLVYSTCSLEKEENQDVVAAVLEERNGVRLLETASRIPGLVAGDGFFAAVLAFG